MRKTIYELIAAEISAVTRYCDELVQLEPLQHDDGLLLDLVDAHEKTRSEGVDPIKDENARRVYLLNGNLNYSLDVQQMLQKIAQKLGRHDRIASVVYNPYLRLIYVIGNLLGLRKGPIPDAFLTMRELRSIATLTRIEIVRSRNAVFIPFKLFGVGTFINRLLAAIPIIKNASLVSVIWMRALKPTHTRPSISIVVPCRNESGNIPVVMERLTGFEGVDTEVIFVEGNSEDDTWHEILRIKDSVDKDVKIKATQQPGKGKFDAVKHGFSLAEGDLVTILDGDLTMPPELLRRYYDAYVDGVGDFINGNRLAYPMEDDAMPTLNFAANKLFGKLLSGILDINIGDSLCGTKLLTRRDYERQCEWRTRFGDFDPFGDFELLYSASVLSLGVVDVPIRYRSRSYGTTQISRFSDGFKLLQMSLIGFLRIKIGAAPPADE